MQCCTRLTSTLAALFLLAELADGQTWGESLDNSLGLTYFSGSSGAAGLPPQGYQWNKYQGGASQCFK